MTKIKLLQRIPVDPRHGLTAGRVLEVLRSASSTTVWVMGDDGTEVRLHRREYEFVEDDDGQTV